MKQMGPWGFDASVTNSLVVPAFLEEVFSHKLEQGLESIF